jgi:hypothetical protein
MTGFGKLGSRMHGFSSKPVERGSLRRQNRENRNKCRIFITSSSEQEPSEDIFRGIIMEVPVIKKHKPAWSFGT